MIDSTFIRNHFDTVKNAILSRGGDDKSLNDFLVADKKWRVALQAIDALRMKQNQLTPKGKPTVDQRNELKELSDSIKKEQSNVASLESDVQLIARQLPNIPLADVPVGLSEIDNVVVDTIGNIPDFSFLPKSHDELGVNRAILNFDQASKMTGSRFVVGYDKGAQLERALINFMLDIHTSDHGYKEVQVPVIVNSQSLYGTGNLPKFGSDLFKLAETDYWLSPTAEVQLTNLFRDSIFQADQLPICVTAATPCFRKEAGSYGKDVRGIIRQHQFNKVELVHIVHPEHSQEHLLQLRKHAETILQLLQLPYRIVELCTADLGFSSAKTFDLEVWFPSQNSYREISSCSNFLDFQSRRSMIRYKYKNEKKVSYVHTLNGSGLAVGRTLAAILENYQQDDGGIRIPDVLKKYIGFSSI
ncbi:serine--tRNA ligase [Candidatus Marinamargulisbacteria bacterium SCGC AG-333-B06]|nr:serine--tRNA ligase [Candidatus Marinamargulisbacteria bacterium SCGC AG-333-B06]